MTNDGAAVATRPDPRAAALLKAVGFDRLAPEQRELALAIAGKYELDTMLKHLVMIDGRPYITRDGLLHVAHRSGQLDGIETTEAAIVDGFWRASASVYRKDMSRPFTYTGRYPTSGGNQKYAPEMAVKVAEVMALRRAFDVAAPVAEERWDLEAVPSASASQPTLAERAAQRAAIAAEGGASADDPTPAPTTPTSGTRPAGMSTGANPTPQEAASAPSDATEDAGVASLGDAETATIDEATASPGADPDAAGASSPKGTAEPSPSDRCASESPYGDGATCGLLPGHKGLHRQLGAEGVVVGSWPDR